MSNTTNTEGLMRIVHAGYAPADSYAGLLIRLRGKVVDVGYTADAHVVRELYVDGHMIGFRQSWHALYRLAQMYANASPERRISIIERENRRPYPRTTPRRPV